MIVVMQFSRCWCWQLISAVVTVDASPHARWSWNNNAKSIHSCNNQQPGYPVASNQVTRSSRCQRSHDNRSTATKDVTTVDAVTLIDVDKQCSTFSSSYHVVVVTQGRNSTPTSDVINKRCNKRSMQAFDASVRCKRTHRYYQYRRMR